MTTELDLVAKFFKNDPFGFNEYKELINKRDNACLLAFKDKILTEEIRNFGWKEAIQLHWLDARCTQKYKPGYRCIDLIATANRVSRNKRKDGFRLLREALNAGLEQDWKLYTGILDQAFRKIGSILQFGEQSWDCILGWIPKGYIKITQVNQVMYYSIKYNWCLHHNPKYVRACIRKEAALLIHLTKFSSPIAIYIVKKDNRLYIEEAEYGNTLGNINTQVKYDELDQLRYELL